MVGISSRYRECRAGYKENENKKMIFWNVAGVYNKDQEFWDYVQGHDFISLSGTWVNVKGVEDLENKLSREHTW